MVTMRYDGDGRRVELITRPNGGIATTSTFRYQGDAMAQEFTGTTPTLVRTYITDDSGTIVKFCDPSCTGTNAQYLVTWNGHGDALAAWRVESTGSLTLANSYTYTSWGEPTTTTHNSIGDLGFRFLYVGADDVQWDNFSGLGLLYMHARHYSPLTARFLQPDPIAAESNFYAYAADNPLTNADPCGTWTTSKVWSYMRQAAYRAYRKGRISYRTYTRIYYKGLGPYARQWPLSIYSYRYGDYLGCEVCMDAYTLAYGLGCAVGVGAIASAACTIVPAAGNFACGVVGSVAGFLACTISYEEAQRTYISARNACRVVGACPPYSGGAGGGF